MFRLTVQDVFSIKGRGTVVTGEIETGSVRVGDEVTIDEGRAVKVKGVEMFRKVLDEAHQGDTVGLLLDGVEKGDIASGAVLTGPGGSYGGPGVSVPGLGLT